MREKQRAAGVSGQPGCQQFDFKVDFWHGTAVCGVERQAKERRSCPVQTVQFSVHRRVDDVHFGQFWAPGRRQRPKYVPLEQRLNFNFPFFPGRNVRDLRPVFKSKKWGQKWSDRFLFKAADSRKSE